MKKRVDQLKPGDILLYATNTHGAPGETPLRSVVITSRPRGALPSTCVVHHVVLAPAAVHMSVSEFERSGSVEFYVEGDALKHNQQHADQMSAILCHLRDRFEYGEYEIQPDMSRRIAALVDMITPPAPTVDELLEALQQVAGDERAGGAAAINARNLIARARRAGVIK